MAMAACSVSSFKARFEAAAGRVCHSAVWWRDHGHPNLFSAAESIGLLRVALDHNVFLDLNSAPDGRASSESGALAEDWLADQVELVVTAELQHELARLPDVPDKSRQLQAAGNTGISPSRGGPRDAFARNISGTCPEEPGPRLVGEPERSSLMSGM